VATGTIIAESLRVGATLAGFSLTVSDIERLAPADISSQQRQAGIPAQWTLLRFELPDSEADRLASALASALERGWYVDFHTATETFVVFARRIFRYRSGDRTGRAEAEAYARTLSIPDPQLDWP
jgi:hypothetical protein